MGEQNSNRWRKFNREWDRKKPPFMYNIVYTTNMKMDHGPWTMDQVMNECQSSNLSNEYKVKAIIHQFPENKIDQ